MYSYPVTAITHDNKHAAQRSAEGRKGYLVKLMRYLNVVVARLGWMFVWFFVWSFFGGASDRNSVAILHQVPSRVLKPVWFFLSSDQLYSLA